MLRDSRSISRFIFQGKVSVKYYAMVNLDTVTFLDPASLYNKLELDVDDQKIAHIVKEKLSQPLARHGDWLAVM